MQKFVMTAVAFTVLISTGTFASAAESAYKSCRGNVKGYGVMALSIKSGFMGNIILRNCGLVGEIAKHFRSEPQNFDTFVMEGFGNVECANTDLQNHKIKTSCELENVLGGDVLRDEIGVEFHKVMSHGAIAFTDLGNESWEVEYLVKARNFPLYQKKFLLKDVACSEDEIAPAEGACQ